MRIAVTVAGIGADRAAAAAAGLVEGGVRLLLSWGMAGGLAPQLAAGALLVPERIVSQERTWPVDAGWRDAVAAAVAGLGGSLWCSDTPITTVAQKQMLAARGMAAVDMESAAVARVAAQAGLPFLAIKAVCDPAVRALPFAALDLVGSDGRVRLKGLARAAIAGPAAWRELNQLRADFDAARSALRRAAETLTRSMPRGAPASTVGRPSEAVRVPASERRRQVASEGFE